MPVRRRPLARSIPRVNTPPRKSGDAVGDGRGQGEHDGDPRARPARRCRPAGEGCAACGRRATTAAMRARSLRATWPTLPNHVPTQVRMRSPGSDGSKLILPGAGPDGSDVVVDGACTSAHLEWDMRLDDDSDGVCGDRMRRRRSPTESSDVCPPA